MNDQVLDLLLKSIDDIKSDLKEVRTEIKALNAFKWKITGIAATASGIVLTVVEIAKAYFFK